MYISALLINGIRCFKERQGLGFSRNINLLVGANNSGKSTLIRALYHWQKNGVTADDLRADADKGVVVTSFMEINWDFFGRTGDSQDNATINLLLQKNQGPTFSAGWVSGDAGRPIMKSEHPDNFIKLFLANRKATNFDENISLKAQSRADGTFSNLYSRVDMLGDGHPDHETFVQACKDVIGIHITAASSVNGKKAGFYFDRNNFIPLERMGDGVAHMVALIAELVISDGNLFLIEEPENDLHPAALKSLLRLVSKASLRNQIIVSTHSNIVVRSLGAEKNTKIFELQKTEPSPQAPTKVVEVPATSIAHQKLLENLGYEFSDFDLWKGWLFLEESSAEEIIRDYLIPWFAPKLARSLRTYSSSGVNNLEPRFDDFSRLFVFLHLEPSYRNRVWVITDGDEAGLKVIDRLRNRFPELDEKHCFYWKKSKFEDYLPERFETQIKALEQLKIDKKRAAKENLLLQVKEWIKKEPDEAKSEFSTAAEEVINTLRQIEKTLNS